MRRQRDPLPAIFRQCRSREIPLSGFDQQHSETGFLREASGKNTAGGSWRSLLLAEGSEKGELASSYDDDVVLRVKQLLASDVGHGILEIFEEGILGGAFRGLEDKKSGDES